MGADASDQRFQRGVDGGRGRRAVVERHTSALAPVHRRRHACALARDAVSASTPYARSTGDPMPRVRNMGRARPERPETGRTARLTALYHDIRPPELRPEAAEYDAAQLLHELAHYAVATDHQRSKVDYGCSAGGVAAANDEARARLWALIVRSGGPNLDAEGLCRVRGFEGVMECEPELMKRAVRAWRGE